MAYTLGYDLNLGISGLTLEAQLKDAAGANVGVAITTGFIDIGQGFYFWDGAAAIPDGHVGFVVFQDLPGGTIRTVRSINPQEAENSDVKVSTRSAHSAANVWDEALEGSFTARQLIRLMGASAAGEASGLAGITALYKAVGDNLKDRITMTVDSDGNRSGAVYDVS